MGVHGLATFLKENRSLCTTLQLDTRSAGSRPRTQVIVDAWGLIFRLYLDSLPWTSGGEYLQFFRLGRRLVTAWRGVGLEPIFVFDGTAPPEKYETLLSRMNAQISLARLFYTTSPASRSSPSFSKWQSILPPLASHTFIHALTTLDVEQHFVPMGEADGVCVVMAEQRGAYVLGQDSDFVILVGEGGKGKGYIPLDMIQWIEGEHDDEAGMRVSNEIDAGSNSTATEWTTTNRKPKTQQTRLSPLLPSTELANPTLVLVVYPPQVLRQRLRLPATVLPLFASLCGNDYTPAAAGEHFFEPGSGPVKKIEKVARVLREQLFSPSAIRATSAGDTAVELVRRVIKRLSVNVKAFHTEQEVQSLVEAIIEATLQYILPSGRDCCANFPFCGGLDAGCGTYNAPITPVVEAYANARRRGRLNVVTALHLYPERLPLWSILEDPSRASLKGAGLRDVRRKAYEIVEGGLGLRWPKPSDEQDPDADEDQAATESSMGDTQVPTETSSDGTLVDRDGETTSTKGRSTPVPPNPPRVIIEYLRSSSRIIAAPLPLSPLPDVPPPTPSCLLPTQRRLEIYLEALQSCTTRILALPSYLHPILACVRFCIIDSSPRDPLRRHEVESVLKMGLASYGAWSREFRGDTTSKKELETQYPILTSRNAQILAKVTAVMTDSVTLAQALLLSDPDGNGDGSDGVVTPSSSQNGGHTREGGGGALTHLTPFMFFSGSMGHVLLSGEEPKVWRWAEQDQKIYEECLQAVVEGVEDKILGWNTVASPKKQLGTSTGEQVAANGGKHTGSKKRNGQADSGTAGNGHHLHAAGGAGNRRKGRGGGSGSGSKQVGGRFGLLEGLTD